MMQMMQMVQMLKGFVKGKKGQGMVEYGLIIGLVAIVVIVALTAMGGGLDGLFDRITAALGGAGAPAASAAPTN